MESYREEVKNKITKQDTLTVDVSFPKDVYRNFKRWANEYASGCYWLAIERLMLYHNSTEFDVRNNIKMLTDRDEVLLDKIVELENRLQEPEENTKEIKTFGRDGNE